MNVGRGGRSEVPRDPFLRIPVGLLGLYEDERSRVRWKRRACFGKSISVEDMLEDSPLAFTFASGVSSAFGRVEETSGACCCCRNLVKSAISSPGAVVRMEGMPSLSCIGGPAVRVDTE